MKFRQKIYVSTILLFIIVLNVSLLAIITIVYQNNLSIEKDRAFVEANYIADTLTIDTKNTFYSHPSSDSAIADIIRSYSVVYEKQRTWVALYSNQTPIFDNLPLPNLEKMFADSFGSRASLVHQEHLKTYFCISLPVSIPILSSNYQLIYVHELAGLQNSMNRLTKLSLIICILGISFLSLTLFFILRRLIAPLNNLSLAVSDISEGNYMQKADVVGNDEVAELSKHFNDMAEEIHKKVSTLEEAQVLKQSLIDNLSHEMRTPLTSIRGYAEYLLLSPASEEERYHALQYIIDESTRLSLMGNRLLMLSQLRDCTLVFELVSLDSIFSKIKDTLSFALAEKNVELIISISQNSLLSDAILLECLLQNLIENAIHACSVGGLVKAAAFWKDDTCCIHISDNGIGMQEDVLSHITEPFFRIDKARSRNDGGAGIGLALCQSIASALGAVMLFSSKPNFGTEVQLTFTTP